MTTKAEILDIARELVQTRSFQGFSFQDIADAVGIRKASLYHHFPSKDELAIALLSRYRDQFLAWTQQVMDQSPQEQLDGYFRIFGDYIGAGQRLCPGGAFVAGWGRLAEPVREEVSGLLADQEDWLAQVLREGMEAGCFNSDNGSPEHQASWIVSTVQGGLLLARTRGQQDVFHQALTLLRKAIFVESEDGEQTDDRAQGQ